MKKLLSVTLITLGISLTNTNIHAMGQNNNSSSSSASSTTPSTTSNTQISPERKEKLIELCAQFIIFQANPDKTLAMHNELRTKAKTFTKQELENIDDEIFGKAAQMAISTGKITQEDLEKFVEIKKKNLDSNQK
jgi:hypothetical protein